MTIKELKDFIIKARRSNPFTFLEVVNALYESLYDLREDLFKKYQFRNSKTFEIVDISNVSEDVKDKVYKSFIIIAIRKSGLLAEFNAEVRRPVEFSYFEVEAIKKLNKMTKAQLEEIVENYQENYEKTVTSDSLLKLVTKISLKSKTILEELPGVVIYLTDETGWTFKGVLGEFYCSTYGSIPLDNPSDRTSEDYLEKLDSKRRIDKAIFDYYDRIGKFDF